MDDRHRTGTSSNVLNLDAARPTVDWVAKEAASALSAPLAIIAVPSAVGPRIVARAGRLAPFGLDPTLALFEQAYRREGALCIENTTAHTGVSGINWRVGGHRIGSYAGHAVRDQSRDTLGVLAVLDRRKRCLRRHERELLAALSFLAGRVLCGYPASPGAACMAPNSTTRDDTDVCVLMLDFANADPTLQTLDTPTLQRIVDRLPEVIGRWLREGDVVEPLTDDALMLLIRGGQTAGERVAWRLHNRLSSHPLDVR